MTAADKRAKCLFLTREGQALVELVEPAVMRSQERILAPLGLKDRKTFVRLLDQMVETNNHASRAPRGPMRATTRRGKLERRRRPSDHRDKFCSSKFSAALAKLCMLACRSALPVSSVITACSGPATAMQLWPAASP